MAVSLGGCCIVDSSIDESSLPELPKRVQKWIERHRPEPGHLAVVESLPRYMERWCERNTEGLTVGGGAANTAWRLADLGIETNIWGYVGDDSWGDFYHDALKRRGIDVGCVKKHDTLPTSRTIVVEGDDRSFIHVLGANRAFTPDLYASLDNAWGVYVGYLYILGDWPESAAQIGEVLGRVKEDGKIAILTTTAAPGDIWEGAEPAIREADIFLTNLMEAAALTIHERPEDMAQCLHDMAYPGAQNHLVGITMGRNGIYLSRKRKSGSIDYDCLPAYNIEPVVRRAAGDSAAAGLLYTIDQTNLDALTCLKPLVMAANANAMGSLAVGGYEHINPMMLRRLPLEAGELRQPGVAYTF